MKRPTLRERLLSKAVINWETGCWEWTAHRNGSGYGVIGLPSRKTGSAHRVAYELIHGPIPDGLDLDHLCRVRHCINPAHLEPVTRRENSLRGNGPGIVIARGDQCSAGHPYTEINTRVRGGKRFCRTCDRARAKRCRERRLGRTAAAKGIQP
jgi:hypothetical protein